MKKPTSSVDLILLTIYKLCNGTRRAIEFEDIVAAAFASHPDEFALDKYPEYPDSAKIYKRLYDNLSPKGYVRVASQKCILTNLGISRGEMLQQLKLMKVKKKGFPGKVVVPKTSTELYRLSQLHGYRMFIGDNSARIIDQDFYDFFESSVRTKKNELKGLIKQKKITIDSIKTIAPKEHENFMKYLELLLEKFSEIVKGVS